MISLFCIIAAGCSFMGTTNGCLIQSPNFPDNYPNNQDKTYNIQVNVGYIIEITFTTFDLEAHSSCVWDWLKIIDKGQGSTLLDKVCGKNLPEKIISKSNNVDVIFHSDYSVTGKGFQLYFRSAKEDDYRCHTVMPPNLFYNTTKSVRGAQKDGITLWDGGLVPYETTSELQNSDLETFLQAAKEIQDGTCIKFSKRTSESAYIKLTRGCDCNQKTGKCTGGGLVVGGLGKRTPSTIEIGTNTCLNPEDRDDVSMMIHLILHCLGVVHTQTRPDRNKHITVLDGNIVEDKQSRYALCPGCLTYNTPYNCMSVMHFRNWFFQKQDAGPTMKAKPNVECDLSTYVDKLADSDLMLLNRMYKCKRTLFTQGYKYHYFPLGEKVFNFKAKAKFDVAVALDSDTNESDLYEIVIGGWTNSVSMVRRGKQGPCISDGNVTIMDKAGQIGWTKTPGIVSPSEFKGFWVSYKYNGVSLTIKVGKEGETSPFMTGQDKKPLDIKFVGLSAFTDVANYIFPMAA